MQLNELIYNALKDVVSAYPMIAPEGATLPFAIYGHRRKPKRTKEGIYAYECEVHIIIVDDDLDNIELLSETIRQNIEGLKGIGKISVVRFEGEEQDYIPDPGIYKTESDFVIIQNL